MSKPAKTAVSEEAKETAVSSQFAGMQVCRLSGVEGYALVPDEQGHLSALAITRYLKRKAPESLSDAPVVFKEFYERSVLIDFQFKELKITDENLTSLDYPAELAYWAYQATQPHLSRIFSKKK